MRGSRGGGGTGYGPPPRKSRQHRAPSSAHQQTAIEMAFCWRADGDPLRILVWAPYPLCKIR